ncbi:uncharacterized protein LOC134778540 [Penaeus indicus]|uniref:uncharacterized protein LOC134778540 n=1 Tax=Penaeus indicus TaxID=29960 RepID=UPI00300DA568
MSKFYEDLETEEGQRNIYKRLGTKVSKHIVRIKQIKDINGSVLTEECDTKVRRNLSNEETQIEPGDLSSLEAKEALIKIKNGKATGPDRIPIEAWKCLDEQGKGDVQDCGNYRGIKLMGRTMKLFERVLGKRRYRYNIVLVGTSKLDVERKLERWRRALEIKSLKISRTQTEYLLFNCQDHIENIKLGKEVK